MSNTTQTDWTNQETVTGMAAVCWKPCTVVCENRPTCSRHRRTSEFVNLQAVSHHALRARPRASAQCIPNRRPEEIKQGFEVRHAIEIKDEVPYLLAPVPVRDAIHQAEELVLDVRA